MHQHRRRKKRPSYGVRTVEISRGKNGFGFTISGQAPCILSCIITGSPAEKAGLRPGDFLIAVNSQNVSKAPHDDVVRLIGNSSGVLKLQIAENYYSDSSEEEFTSVVKLRPKYPNKVRNKHQNSVSRAERVVHDLQTGALFVDHIHGSKVSVPQKQNVKSQSNSIAGTSRTNKVLLDLILQQRLQDAKNRSSPINSCVKKNICPATVPPDKAKFVKKNGTSKLLCHPDKLSVSSNSASEVFHSIFTEEDLNNILYPAIFASQSNAIKDSKEEQAILKAVVGYLGTIEMPKRVLPNSRLQTIRNCIRRLRIEKKVHTLLLLSVFSDSIVLINPEGITLAEFSADKISFSGTCSDDETFFGLVTNHGRSDDFHEEDSGSVSSSCHVFMVDNKLTPHHEHIKRAKAFHIICTADPKTKKCKEFPESVQGILQAVVGLYKNKVGFNSMHGLEFQINTSPQPSNTSSNSSNSDSGIGVFRDEGNISDRVFVVDVGDNYNEHTYGAHTNSLNRQGYTNSGFSLLDSTHRSLSKVNHSQSSDIKSGKCSLDRLTVRAMPDPVGFEEQHCTSLNNNSEQLSNTNSIMQLKQDSLQSSRTEINQEISFSLDDHSSKLSPKVFNSLNFISKSEDETASCNISTESTKCKCMSCSREDLKNPLLLLHDSQGTVDKENIHRYTLCEKVPGDDSESEISVMEEENDSSQKWGRTSSLRRNLGRKRSLYRGTHDAGTVSDTEIASGKVSSSSSMLALDLMSNTSHHSSCTSERPIDVGRVGSWAAAFNVLLEDPAGLFTFREFLKMEFSEENISFWISCEQYRKLIDQNQMNIMAKDIYNKYLCIGATEPVNIDSRAREVAQDGLNSPTPDLFLLAQKQIFNLMKFDSYARFLKSAMFKECMLREMEGEPLCVYEGELNSSDFENEKEKINSVFKKRKSLIPWHRLSKTKSNKFSNRKDGDIRKSLKKKKKEKGFKIDDVSSTHSDITDPSSLTSSEPGAGIGFFRNMSSRESLNSVELTLFPNKCGSDGLFCRVILPDMSTTVVRTEKGESVGEMLLTLLERRNLSYNAVEAYIFGSHEPLDHCTDVASLSCKEIKVEEVILFCVELPNKKTIGVKAKNNKACGDILKPVLQKYGFSIDRVVMTVASTNKLISRHAPISTIDNEKIIVEAANTLIQMPDSFLNKETFPDLEELTNQIFDDLLKTRPEFHYDRFNAVTSERNKEIKNGISTQSSVFYNKGHFQHDLDTLPSRSKQSEKMDGTNASEQKPLIPHNLTNTKTMYQDMNDSSHSGSTKDHFKLNSKFDTTLKELSHGKENCPLTNNDIINNMPFMNNIEIDYGLAEALQNMETNFAHDVYSSHLSEKYFQRAFTPSCYEETSSEKFLQNLGIIPSDVLPSRSAHWLKSSISHLPPRIPPRVRSTEHKESALMSNRTSSPVPIVDPNLVGNDSFELDLDVDVTLRAQSDDSLSSQMCFQSDQSPNISAQIIDRDISKDNKYAQAALRRLSYEPPPVPPKASSRGPPPRPPSRQHSHINPAFCGTSEDDMSDEGGRLETKNNTDCSSLHSKSYVDNRKDCGEYNISFV